MKKNDLRVIFVFYFKLGTNQTSKNSIEALCPDNEITIAPTGLILREAGTGQE